MFQVPNVIQEAFNETFGKAASVETRGHYTKPQVTKDSPGSPRGVPRSYTGTPWLLPWECSGSPLLGPCGTAVGVHWESPETGSSSLGVHRESTGSPLGLGVYRESTGSQLGLPCYI